MRTMLVKENPRGFRTIGKLLEFNGREMEETAVTREMEETAVTREMKTMGGAITNPLEMRLCLPTQKGFTIVKLDEIVYCQANRSYSEFHFTNKRMMVICKPLFDYDRILSGTQFLRVHKSFLINLAHVKEYIRGEGGTVIMSNNMEIEVSRRRKELFLDQLKRLF
ncbi:LytR/AlgR family response regulator transcription factor [Flavitalea flava]